MSFQFLPNDCSDDIKNAKLLLRLLYERGASDKDTVISGVRARKELGWEQDDELFKKAVNILKDHGRIIVGQGQGGTLFRVPASDLDEGKYYEPIINQIKGWVQKQRDIHGAQAVETLVSRVRNPGKGVKGTWENPDAVAYRLINHKYFPGRNLETISFEIKAKSGMDKKAVYEATAHWSFHNLSYVFLVLPEYKSITNPSPKGVKVGEIIDVAKQTGIGVTIVIEPDDYETWEILVSPEIHFPSPAIISQNIERLNLSGGEVKEKIEKWCAMSETSN